MSSLLTLSESDLERLTPDRAVRFFRDLLWAECRRIDLPTSAVHISSGIDVADGGIDATVTRNTSTPASGLIQNGLTSYRIKTGTSFNPTQSSAVQKELFGTKEPSRSNLADRVRQCLDEDGRYVLVCFGADPPDRTKAIVLTESLAVSGN